MRWALVSATYSLPPATLNPVGSANSGPASQPSLSPPANVLHSFVNGSSTLILLLYVSARNSLPSCQRTPMACCKRTFSPVPSTSPKSNRPSPTSVLTCPSPPSGTARTALTSQSATYSDLPSPVRPLGWAN